MLNLVVDANVLKGYFEETVIGSPHSLSDSAVGIFEADSSCVVLYHDDGGIVEQEWRQLVEPEWFSAWLARLYTEDRLKTIARAQCPQIKACLKTAGFPVRSRDFTYIRTAEAVGSAHANSSIVSDDMHFFNPKKAKCPAPGW